MKFVWHFGDLYGYFKMDHWVLERQWGSIDEAMNFKPVISLNIIHLWSTVVKIQMRPWTWSTKKILFTVISYLYSVTLGRVPMEQAQPSSWMVYKGCLCSLPLGAVSLAAFLLSRQQTQKTGLVRESDRQTVSDLWGATQQNWHSDHFSGHGPSRLDTFGDTHRSANSSHSVHT